MQEKAFWDIKKIIILLVDLIVAVLGLHCRVGFSLGAASLATLVVACGLIAVAALVDRIFHFRLQLLSSKLFRHQLICKLLHYC